MHHEGKAGARRTLTLAERLETLFPHGLPFLVQIPVGIGREVAFCRGVGG
ncbi:MAG: hypothetical protein ACK5QX_02570 [bacterium]